MSAFRKLRCSVQKITDHGGRVYTVDLTPEHSAPRFKPGQFLHLALDDYDPSAFWPDSRVFSIASSPANRDNLRISYSVRGKYTARMENELMEGRSLWVKMPYGEFFIRDSKDVVLLAGGTGITAFTAFIEHLSPNYPNRVYLAYGARNRSLLTYRPLLEEQASKIEKLRVFYFVENGSCRIVNVEKTIAGNGQGPLEIPGYIDIGGFWSSVRDPLDSVFYVSGPPAMNRSLSDDLLRRGIKKTEIVIDAWE